MKEEVKKFKAIINRTIFENNSSCFRICSATIDDETKKKLNLKKGLRGEFILCGTFQELTNGAEYNVEAVEEDTEKYGYQYRVLHIGRDRPHSAEEMYMFLSDILTENQAETLYREYPNIVQKIIDEDLDDVNLSKLPGIKEKRFNQIKEKVIENIGLAEMIIEFKGVLSKSIIDKLYEKYTSLSLAKRQLKKDPYGELCKLSGVGFKKADDIVIKLDGTGIIKFKGEIQKSSQRCAGAIVYLLKENELSGNTCMDLIELKKAVEKLVPACSDKFIEAMQSDNIYYDKTKKLCALRTTYLTEKYIADDINKRLNSKVEVWDYNIEKYRNIDGIDLSDEQMGLLDAVCKNNIVILTAPGGCGKSFSTKALINMLKDNYRNFFLASPTGKAAKKLASYTGEKASTVHRLLSYQESIMKGNEDDEDSRFFYADVILIDEIGMTDIYLLSNLLEYIKPTTKIVLIGDEYQLNSVGAGAVLRDLTSYPKIPHVRFTKVYRMGEGGVLTACTYVRQNKKFLYKNELTKVGKDESFAFIYTEKEKINSKIIKLYQSLLQKYDPKDITVIASYNIGQYGCDILNTMLQPIANPNARDENRHIKVKNGDRIFKYFVGDNVIANANRYKAPIYIDGSLTDETCMICNGESGVVKEVNPEGLIIDFDGVDILYERKNLNKIKHSFALSVFKMQGSQSKNIIFSCCSAHTYMLNNNIIYTALSRAEEKVYMFGDVKTINMAMAKSDNKQRVTWLGILLKE